MIPSGWNQRIQPHGVVCVLSAHARIRAEIPNRGADDGYRWRILRYIAGRLTEFNEDNGERCP